MLATIGTGRAGWLVFILQCFLGLLKIDGQFGEKTKARLADWQRAHGLNPDAICGPLTWAALFASLPTIQKGDVSDIVRGLQYLLGCEPDGIFGMQTDEAVRTFQKNHGLKVDGIVGPLTWAELLNSAEQPAVVAPVNSVVDYKQYDPRWGKIMFSNHNDPKQTIASSGCGPTAVAGLLATWIDPAITPKETCKLAVDSGFRTYNSGLAQAFMPFIAHRYGLQCTVTTSTVDAVAALKSGALVVALMGPGFWTNGGHYILLRGVDGNQIYANDPASVARTHASIELFERERKKYFIFRR